MLSIFVWKTEENVAALFSVYDFHVNKVQLSNAIYLSTLERLIQIRDALFDKSEEYLKTDL